MERQKYKKVWILPCVRFEELVTDVIPDFLNRRFYACTSFEEGLRSIPFSSLLSLIWHVTIGREISLVLYATLINNVVITELCLHKYQESSYKQPSQLTLVPPVTVLLEITCGERAVLFYYFQFVGEWRFWKQYIKMMQTFQIVAKFLSAFSHCWYPSHPAPAPVTGHTWGHAIRLFLRGGRGQNLETAWCLLVTWPWASHSRCICFTSSMYTMECYSWLAHLPTCLDRVLWDLIKIMRVLGME